MAYITGTTQEERQYGAKKKVAFTATAGQTVFTPGFDYIPGSNVLEVYINGVKQAGSAYTESQNFITLTEGVEAGDIVEIVSDVVEHRLTGEVEWLRRNYGPYPSDPTQRPDGTAMVAGDEYFNSTLGKKKYFNGSIWVLDSAVLNFIKPTIIGFDATGFSDGEMIYFKGRDTVGDGDGGMFRYSIPSSATVDNVIVFAATGGGRLERLGWSTTIDLAWAGAKGDGATDDTAAINAAAVAAKSRNIRYLTAKPGDYYCTGELIELDNVLIIGTRAKITSQLANNYYARIYDPAHQPATPSINPQVNKRGLSRFFSALNRYRNGGAAPVVVFIGDSLTQGGHRAFDNFFWVQQFKQKLNEAYGIQMDYKNRGIAGRAAGDVANAVGLADVHAPFESNWVTNPSNTWLSYISALNPDLVVVAFGMNSANANDSADVVNLRNSLKALPSTPSLVWVTTPIRTTDLTASYAGSRFGTYPGNQYSNNNGYMTRLIADFYGDPVIDVNRMSNIVQLGVDPYDYAIDRWAGLYVDNSKKFTGSIPIIVNPDGTLDLPIGGGNEFTTNELFREVFVDFEIASGATVNPARVEMRQDPNSASGVVLLFKPTSIELYYTTFTGGNFGLQQTYATSPTAGNRYRIELSGKVLRLYVINGSGSALLGEVNNILGSTFLAPVRFVGQGTTNATLKNVVIYGASRDTYKQYIPRLTAAEVFRVWYGGGGNNLNHPNTRGELEIYSQPIDEFVSTLKSVDPESSYASGTLTLNAGITAGLATYRVVDGKYVTISFVDLQVTSALAANSLLTSMPAEIRPSETVYGTLWPLYGSTVVGFDIRLSGDSYLGAGLSAGSTYKGTISYVI